MGGAVTVDRASLVDLTYVAANLRPVDRVEMLAQMPKGTTPMQAVMALADVLPSQWTFAARIGGQPVAIYGFHPYSSACWIGFCFGTRRLPRVIPAITRHGWRMEQALIDAGVRRVEVRLLASHMAARRWLLALGAEWECDLPDFGTSGETFQLWSWSLSRGRPTQETSYRHVLPQAA